MKCLYCGKGIGPFRQLRDVEFCSQEHRTQFRERYRRQLYEALAPEPAPVRTADFIGQAAVNSGPAPVAMLRKLSRSQPDECKPILRVKATGVSVDRPAWILGKSLTNIPARLAWQDARRQLRVAAPGSSFSIGVRAPQRPAAGPAATNLVGVTPSPRQPLVAKRIPGTRRGLPLSVPLPQIAQAPTPVTGQPARTQLRAVPPRCAEPLAIGPVPSIACPVVALPASPVIAGPVAPAHEPAVVAPALSPAEPHSQPTALIVEPLPARCVTKSHLHDAGILLPTPPAAAGSSNSLASTSHPAIVQPELRLSFSRMKHEVSLPDVLSDPSTRPVALAPMAAMAAPQACEVLAGPLQAAGSVVPALAGIPNLRSAAAEPFHGNSAAFRQELAALPSGVNPAPLCLMDAPVPAAPPAATPAWDAATALSPDHPIGVAPPRIDCLPALAGPSLRPGPISRPDAARAVRSSAVLWTLRVVHMCNPPFRMDPVRARFNDLVRASQGTPYSGDLEHQPLAKNNLRHFRRPAGAGLGKQGWLFAGAAAAALLLAAVLRPHAATKSLQASAPRHGVSFRQWVAQRATRSFEDDFRAGFNQWKVAQAKGARTWSYSTDGYIRPGELALYRPSVPLSDYRFEFMTQVESKSVDWVVRAHDAGNYYALKFAIVQPGPRPIMAMVRYAVVDGTRGARVQTPLRMMIHANTPYRVTVDVKGNQYRAYVEGQQADYWTDDRFKTGGVGFFSESGERARVYWVKLESHGDILGRICGLLSGKSSEGETNKETQVMDYRHAETTDISTASVPSGTQGVAATAQEARISRVLSKAAALHLDGKPDEGARELVRALDGGERHPALYFALGQLQYEMQEYAPAAQSYSQAALLQPLHPTAYFNAGVCLGRTERWEEAVVAFRKALSNDPARSEAHLALGACLVQLGLYNEALDAYDRFLARHPDNDEALFGKAVALQKRDRGSEAAELYRHVLNHNPRSEEALSNLVSLSLANQDYEQVRKYAERLVEVQPKSQIALEGLAGAAFATGDHRAAADYSRKLAELAPQVFENWFNLGVACHKAGDLAHAAEAYARAAKVQPGSPQAQLNLGVALQEQGDLKAARAAYERALQIDPRLPGVHWNLGLVHEQLDDSEAAERLYAQVPQDSPDSDDATFRIGHLRLQRADYAGSIQAFDACLQRRPDWPEARLNLGIAQWRAGDKEAARACFQELTTSGSASKEALRGFAALSLEHGDYDKAFEIYRQLLDAGERSPELLYNAGLICQRRGEAEDAAVLYKEALKVDPQFGEALLNLGHALMSLGNEFEARSCWRKAVIAKPELAQRYFEPAQSS